jgi:hypothetical protein
MIGNIYTLIIAPGIAMGIIGAIAANRIIEHSCHCFQHLKEQRIS